METTTQNFFSHFVKQMVCLKFMIVTLFVFLFAWSPLKIISHYLGLSVPSYGFPLFFEVFLVLWFSSLVSDRVTGALVPILFNRPILKYLQFCDSLLAHVGIAFPNFAAFSIKAHFMCLVFYCSDLLGLLEAPFAVELYFMSYTLRTLFVMPVFALTAIQQHELYPKLVSQFYTQSLGEELLLKEGLKVYRNLAETPGWKRGINSVMVVGAIGVLASGVIKHNAVAGVDALNDQAKRLADGVDVSNAGIDVLRQLTELQSQAYKAESMIRYSSGMGIVARNALRQSRGELSLGGTHREARNGEAELVIGVKNGVFKTEFNTASVVSYVQKPPVASAIETSFLWPF